MTAKNANMGKLVAAILFPLRLNKRKKEQLAKSA
jgi:hypothetical protein